MSRPNPEYLLNSIYASWDLVTEEEKIEVNKIDDKLSRKGKLGPQDLMSLKNLLKAIDIRAKDQL